MAKTFYNSIQHETKQIKRGQVLESFIVKKNIPFDWGKGSNCNKAELKTKFWCKKGKRNYFIVIKEELFFSLRHCIVNE